MSPFRRSIAALTLLGALAVLAYGCGETVIDNVKAADTLKASLESKQEGFGRKVQSVECPSGVKVEVGTKFECTVTFADGKTAHAVMKIRDSEADLNLEDLVPHTVATESENGSK